MGQTICWVKQLFGGRNIFLMLNIILWGQFFLVKIVWTFGGKNFHSKDFVKSELCQNFWVRKNFWVPKILCPKFFWVKKFVDQKNFFEKNTVEEIQILFFAVKRKAQSQW